jgi:hypothetical protein
MPKTSPSSTRRLIPSTARNVSRWSASRRSRCQIVRRPFSKSFVSPVASIAMVISFHADEHAVAVRILDVEDGAGGTGCDGIADALALVAGKAGHELKGGIHETDGDAQVDHLAATLGDPDAELPAAGTLERLV